MIFNIFSREKQCVQIYTETPYICQKNIEEKNKKCQNFYENISSDFEKQDIYECPHGLCAFKTKDAIYTCLNIVEKNNMKKLVPNFKRYNQNINQFTQYSLSQITRIIDEYEKRNYETQIRRSTIHDIKNASKHFADLVEDVKSDSEIMEIVKSNDKLLSLEEGYNLVQYRLEYHDKLLNYEEKSNDMANINFHQAITKLTKILMYRGIKKGVQIKFVGHYYNSFLANKDLYLMYFILIENALKFSTENSEVEINFLPSSIENQLVVDISNECHSMNKEETEKVFISGFRGESAIKTSKGSGLGLALAKKIADTSNVRISCEYIDMADGKGKFTIKCEHKQ